MVPPSPVRRRAAARCTATQAAPGAADRSRWPPAPPTRLQSCVLQCKQRPIQISAGMICSILACSLEAPSLEKIKPADVWDPPSSPRPLGVPGRAFLPPARARWRRRGSGRQGQVGFSLALGLAPPRRVGRSPWRGRLLAASAEVAVGLCMRLSSQLSL
ncbi:unnamed protein product [Prorocentrum cordatum]|uniref:Uncharacterized protein n=1 Tax=Prorocentrum cordatum TaxID=2364126 RepID=A0ABN9X9K4_9DINO|nr:unnamed protein product [Polarella glacialis]